MKKALLSLVALLSISSYSFGNSSFSTTTVSKLIVHDNGNTVIIEVPINVNNQEDCTVNNRLALLKSHPFFNEIYSAMLSAFHAGTSFSGWVDGCNQWNYPIIRRLDLVK